MARKIDNPSIRGKKEKSGQCLDFNKMLLYNLGFWRKKISSKRQPLRTLIFLIPRAFLILQVLLLIANLIDTFMVIGQMEYLTENLAASIINTLSLIKVITLTFQSSQVKLLVHDLEKMKDNQQYSDRTERKIFKKHRLISKAVTFMFMSSCIITGINYIFVPHFEVKDTDPSANLLPLPQRGYYPFNTSDPFNYQALRTFIYMTGVYNGISIGIFDTLFVSMMINTIGQLKILQYKLQNIRQISLNEIDTKHEERYVNTLHGTEKSFKAKKSKNRYPDQQSDSVKQKRLPFKFVPKAQILVPSGYSVPYTRVKPATYNQLFQCSTESNRATFKHIKVDQCITHEKAAGDSNGQPTKDKPDASMKKVAPYSYSKEEIDATMERNLGRCVEHHQAIISFVGLMEKVFWNALVFQIIASLAVCVIVYQITLLPDFNARAIFLLQIVMGAVAELFMFCWFSSVLTDECYKLNEAIYYSEWRDASASFKRSMQIVMCRTEQPTEFTVAGLVPLSLVVFRRVVKQSYSMFSLITGLDNGAAFIQQ